MKLFKKYCKKIKYVDVKNIGKAIWGLVTRKGLIIDGFNSGDVIEKIINEAAIEKGIYNINQIKMPLLIPSVELNSGALYMFSSIEKRNTYSDEIIYVNNINIGKAVRASCSYPGVFSPCNYDKMKLIDGGIRENIPWKEAKLNGAEKVLCIKFQKEKSTKQNKNIIDVVSGAIDILCQELGNYEIAGADYVLSLKTRNISLLDCSKIDELYYLGYIETKKYIKKIKR